MKKILIITSLIIVSFFGIDKLSAMSWTTITDYNVVRSYAICPKNSNSCDIVNSDDRGSVSSPFQLLYYNETQDRALFGLRISKNINYTSPERFTQLSIDVTLRQDRVGNWKNSLNTAPELSFSAGTDGTYTYSCSVTEITSNDVRYNCVASFDNYAYIESINFRIGTVSNNNIYSTALGLINHSTMTDNGQFPYASPIWITYVGVGLESSADPSLLLIQDTNNKLDDLNQSQQETNNKLDDLNNNLTDDSVDTDNASNFFDSFNNKDHGGLSAIITAPLNAIVKITDTCEPITIPVLDKNIELPCGNTLFWDKAEVQTFRAIWNVLIGGPILYALLAKLFNIIEGLKNPDDDRIEVTKL